MVDKRDVSLENVPNAFQRWLEQENIRRVKFQEMKNIAPLISKTIIELDYHLTSDSVNYWYFNLPKELQQFSKDQLSLFLGWLDVQDPTIIISVSTDSSRSFPNNQFETIYGVTFDITFGQGSDVCVYKNAS